MKTVYVSQCNHHAGMSFNNMSIGNVCYMFFFCSFVWLPEHHNGNMRFITYDKHRGGRKYRMSGMKLLTSNDSIHLSFELLYIF